MQPPTVHPFLDGAIVQLHRIGVAPVFLILAPKLIVEVGVGWILFERLLEQSDATRFGRVRVRVFRHRQQFQNTCSVFRIDPLPRQIVRPRGLAREIAERLQLIHGALVD